VCIVFAILCYCVCNFCVMYCFECVCVILCFLCIVLCIVVPLPPGTYPLAVNNNNNNNNNNSTDNFVSVEVTMFRSLSL
jgi:hypothetical protein